jgi:alginate O-acetyltransferase complex protein AlgI
MLFHTPTFLVFLVAVLLATAALRGTTARKILLLLASVVFYGWANPFYLVPLAATIAVDYAAGLALDRLADPRRRRGMLFASLGVNLGLLAWFKYANFLMENGRALASALDLPAPPTFLQVVLPVGISFYTFHSMSYTIDVYRRETPVCRSLLDFALFITFFPVLVAGPILRAASFLPQLRERIRLDLAPESLLLFLRGLAKKVVIADNVAPFADAVFRDPARWPSVMIWLGTAAFAVQIYCDFSGYSDMARALARLFGLEIPLNFDRPYFAVNPSDFWRRWHISLSTWLRDYLYVPLGGNRHGRLSTCRNLLLTMLLGGLWHGASWNFVLWGALHGGLLAAHRVWRLGRPAAPSRLKTVLSWAAMQYLVLLTWIAFRVTDTRQMLVALRKFVLFDFELAVSGLGVGTLLPFSTLLLLAIFAALHTWSHVQGDLDARLARLPLPIAAAACAAIGFALFVLWPTAQKPFLYFQF